MSFKSNPNNLQLIVSLCESLSKTGVTPTIALIKKHAARPLPLPEIISVLKNWKLDPNHYPKTDVALATRVEPQRTTASEIIQQLEARIDKLEQQMARVLKSVETD